MKPKLNDLLQKAEVPDRDADYWQSFPGEVTRELRMRGQRPVSEHHSRGGLPRLVWGAALACCLVLAFGLGFWRGKGSHTEELRMAAAKEYFKEIEGLFPNQVRAIILDKDGPRLVLSEGANVPNATPVYLRICQGKNCQSIITFSGQQIDLDGDRYDVLLAGSGEVILAGRKNLWSSKDARRQTAREKIEAHPLDLSL